MSKTILKLNKAGLELTTNDLLAKRGKTQSFTFTLKPEVVKEFKKKCSENNLSMSFLIETFMNSYEGIENT